MPDGHTGVRKRHDSDPEELLKTTDDVTNLANTGKLEHGEGRTPLAGRGLQVRDSLADEAALVAGRWRETACASAKQAIAIAGNEVIGRVEDSIGQDTKDRQH